MKQKYSTYETDDFFEKPRKRRNRRRNFNFRNIKEDIEVYQVIGLLGFVIALVGAFLPVYSVKFYGTSKDMYYRMLRGKYLLAFLFLVFLLMILCFQKFSIIPSLFILTYNLSIRLGLHKLNGYFEMRIGYKCVMLGVSILLVSVFLINTGYAKDSAFRHNSPIMKKDVIWICIAIALALIAATIIKVDKNSDIFYKDIEKYKAQDIMLSYNDSQIDIVSYTNGIQKEA